MRSLAVVLAGAWLASGSGCLSSSYRVSGDELRRLATIPPEQRGERVRVAQEMTASEVEPAQPVTEHTTIYFGGNIDIAPGGGGGGYHPSGAHAVGTGHGGHVGGGGVHLGGGGGGGDGKAAAIIILVVAAVALVAVAAVEGARFDGFTQLHPMMPVHLFGRDGQYVVVPLAQLDPELAAWADHGIVREDEGPWHPLERAPLSRQGMTYAMSGGAATLRSADGGDGAGTAASIQLGYFVTPEIGILGNWWFGWRNNNEGGTLFQTRYMLELDALPVHASILHGGAYLGGGGGTTLEDGFAGRNSTALEAGLLVQLAIDTRLALTARFGVASADDQTSRDFLVGLSVY